MTAQSVTELPPSYNGFDAWNAHDGERLAALMTPDVVYEDVAAGRELHGRAEVAGWVATSVAFSSDFRFDVVSLVVSGDAYATEWIMSGTNDGELEGLAPTGRTYRVRGVTVGRVSKNGKIKENRDYWNMADLLKQLGHL